MGSEWRAKLRVHSVTTSLQSLLRDLCVPQVERSYVTSQRDWRSAGDNDVPVPPVQVMAVGSHSTTDPLATTKINTVKIRRSSGRDARGVDGEASDAGDEGSSGEEGGRLHLCLRGSRRTDGTGVRGCLWEGEERTDGDGMAGGVFISPAKTGVTCLAREAPYLPR